MRSVCFNHAKEFFMGESTDAKKGLKRNSVTQIESSQILKPSIFQFYYAVRFH